MVGALMTEEASNKDKVMQRRLMITVERKEIENTRRHDARYYNRARAWLSEARVNGRGTSR